MTVGTLKDLMTQHKHMDEIEVQLLYIQEQLKIMRLEFEELMGRVVEEERE